MDRKQTRGDKMIGEIICVGNELLYGDTLNTNTQYISQQLALLGVNVAYQLVVGDDEAHLLEAIDIATKRADIIIFSGGLGPTYDDMTKETLTKALKQELVLDVPSFKAIKAHYQRIGREMKGSSDKQAYRPSEGRCLANGNGTAPGIYVVNNNHHYFLLPGPPRELKPMFRDKVKPIIADLSPQVINSKLYGLAGIGESDLVLKIGHIMDNSDNPRIAPYVTTGSVNIRITAQGSNQGEVDQKLREAQETLLPFIAPYLYSEDGDTIETVVVEKLSANHCTVSTAESCTGGLISSRLINIPGASNVFMNGFITYSNTAKVKWVQVKPETLEAYGAVSEEVATEMADGVRRVSDTDFGIGITGIAGPGGGTEDKPVGTVCIAIVGEQGNDVRTYKFSGNRQKIREISAQYALVQLLRYLERTFN